MSTNEEGKYFNCRFERTKLPCELTHYSQKSYLLTIISYRIHSINKMRWIKNRVEPYCVSDYLCVFLFWNLVPTVEAKNWSVIWRKKKRVEFYHQLSIKLNDKKYVNWNMTIKIQSHLQSSQSKWNNNNHHRKVIELRPMTYSSWQHRWFVI